METTNYYIPNHDKRLILTKYIEVDDEDSNDDDMLNEIDSNSRIYPGVSS